MSDFLATADGMLGRRAIVLIEDYPDDGADWRIHYAYGSEIRVTSADGELVREFLNSAPI